MRLGNIAHLYVVRLKARVVLVQELFAVLGIAVGVALLFASQVASTSLDASVAQLTSGVVGQSTYQLKARSDRGFSQALLGEVKRLPGISAAVPVLEAQASVIGPRGSQHVDLLATDPGDVHLAGKLLRRFAGTQVLHERVLALPAPIAENIGVAPLEAVGLQIGAHVVRALVGIELTERSIGPLINSPIAIASLSYAQKLTQMKGRLTRIFVQARPGAERGVYRELVAVASRRINVNPADYEITLFNQAASSVNQSTTTFAAICALVGFLFAYCAMLLTMDLRRRLVQELRRSGTTRWETVQALLFDAIVLAVVASVIGLALGDLLSLGAFSSPPGFLSLAFPIGPQRVITWKSILIAMSAGVLAACIGVLTPVRDIWAHGDHSDTPSKYLTRRWRATCMLVGGCLCIGVTTAILFVAPQSAIVGIVTLIAALFLLLPLLLDLMIKCFDRAQRQFGLGVTEIAIIELRSPKTRARSLATAATAAVAVFGVVVIQGARSNLQHGLDRLVNQLSVTADLWIVPSGKEDLLATTSFRGVPIATLANLPYVRAAGAYYASFLEYGNRRVWVLAPPLTASSAIPTSQLTTGNLPLANARLREGGWAVISKTLAAEHHLHIGATFTLPSPHETSFRIAALMTNLGWPPGAIILNAKDYKRAWETSDPSAYNVMLTPHASLPAVRNEIRSVLGPQSGLVIETATQREQSQKATGRQGLVRLTQIALLVLVAGSLATATIMGAAIWQRRRRFGRMRVQGYEPGFLWRALICESALLIGASCLIGASLGIYGQILLSHALSTVTGFPVVTSANILIAFTSFALVTVVAAACIAVPGYKAVRIAPYPWPDT